MILITLSVQVCQLCPIEIKYQYIIAVLNKNRVANRIMLNWSEFCRKSLEAVMKSFIL